MISATSSLVREIFAEGTIFQLAFLIIMATVIYASFYLGKHGRRWEIRPLEGLEAMLDGIGRCAEMGRPIIVIPGISDLSDPSTFAGLSILGEVAKRSAEIGVTTFSVASATSVILVSEAIMRGAFTAGGKANLYEPGRYVRWFGDDQFSYAVGASGFILAQKPGMLIQVGYFIAEIPVVAESGARVGALQIGGTLSSMDLIAMFSDYIFIGEEMYAAAAAVTQDPVTMATLVGQDWIRLIATGIVIIGAILMVAGSSAVADLMGV